MWSSSLMSSYNKPPLSVQEQAQLLLDKGLICDDKARLERYLSTIGYYRLSVYWFPFLSQNKKQFIPDTTFDKILEIYIFDRKLRLLIMEALERIEVTLRAQWSSTLALHSLALHHNNHDANNCDNSCGSHAYTNPDFFRNTRYHQNAIDKIQSEFREISNTRGEAFILHYKNKYSSPALPPIWAVVETMTFGELSRWFNNTNHTETNRTIMLAFGMPNIGVTKSIFHTLTLVRNICAHHGRLWNRKFVFSLQSINRMRSSLVYRANTNELDNHLYNYLVVIEALLRTINPHSSWTRRLIILLKTREANDHKAMGFPDDWKKRSPWKDNVRYAFVSFPTHINLSPVVSK